MAAKCALARIWEMGRTMGMIGILLGLATGGRPSFSRGRAEKYARQTRNATRMLVAQNAIQMRRDRRRDIASPAVPVAGTGAAIGAAPGWYADQIDPTVERWFDGAAWSPAIRPRAR